MDLFQILVNIEAVLIWSSSTR